MPESTLSLTYDDLAGDVGLFLGYGRGLAKGDTAWSDYQKSVIDAVIRSGLRQFYFPPIVEGGASYDWSFLKPTATMTIASGQQSRELPEDFGGIDGQITILSDSLSSCPLPVVGEGMVRDRYSRQPSMTGRPLLAAVRPRKGTSPAAGQRFDLFIYPTTDAAYSLQFTYYVLADALSAGNPYAYGGMAHAETILESCLSIAEERLDDASAVHAAKFQQRLTASISIDRRLKPQKVGYNGDRSDERRSRPNSMFRGWLPTVDVNGTEY